MESDTHKKRPLDRSHPDPVVLQAAIDVLRKGELIVLPTETVYGLAGDLRLPGVREKIYRAKGRPESKPIPLFAHSVEQVAGLGAELDPAARRLAEAFWPGPLTLVLRTGKDFTGFRIPDYPPILALLEAYGSVLGVTSANRSGAAAAVTADEAGQALEGWVALILDAGPSPGSIPSTVVKVADNTIAILREGAIPAEKIAETIKKTDHA